MKVFRKLKANEIEARIAVVGESKTQLLLYKTARTDMDILDETFGANGWQDAYEEIKGNLYCKIGIWSDKLNQWIWKQDCGVESKGMDGNEKKAEASDAFKRAGFKWGIGRELYTAPDIWVFNDQLGGVVSKEYNGKTYRNLKNPWQKFIVSYIEYNDQDEIKKLIIKNDRGVVLYDNTHNN